MKLTPKVEYEPLYRLPQLMMQYEALNPKQQLSEYGINLHGEIEKLKKIRYYDLWGGRGRGGSHEATQFALFLLTTSKYIRIALLRYVYNDVRTSLWQDLKDRVTESELDPDLFHEKENEMKLTYTRNGNFVKAFGAKADKNRRAKLKSLAGFNVVIIEEADELEEDQMDQVDDSLRTIKGPPPIVIRIFNPPGRLHWIWKRDYILYESDIKGYWRAKPRTDRNLVSIFSTWEDNARYMAPSTIEKWKGYEQTKPEYYLTIIKGLIGEGQRGRVFNGWQSITQDDFRSIEARSVFGLDFGWSESPMGLVELKFVKNKIYGREHIYQPMTLKKLAIEMCKLGLTGKDIIIADSEDPVSINKLRNGWARNELSDDEIEKYPMLLKGFYILGAIKGPGSVNKGISDMKDLVWHICEDSVNFWNEYREYKWALDKDKNPTDVPIDDFNHLIDPARYVVTARGKLW